MLKIKNVIILILLGLTFISFSAYLYIRNKKIIPAEIYQSAGMYELAEREFQNRILDQYKDFDAKDDSSKFIYDAQIDLFYFYIETNQIEKAKLYVHQINKDFRRKFIKSISSCEEIISYSGKDIKENALMLLSSDICSN